MSTIISIYLFNITFCVASIYVDYHMQSGILGYTSLFDGVVSSIARVPVIFRALPSAFLKKIAALYQIGAANLANEQTGIHDLTYDEALVEKRRYQKGLALLGSLESKTKSIKPAEQELLTAALELIKRLRENIFLMDLIINHELEPGDQLMDLLEDYYDGLLIEQRKNEEHVPWEQVKARLNAKHNLG